MSPFEQFVVRSRRKVRLGPVTVDLRSNEQAFTGMRYFPSSAQANEAAPSDYTLSFCNLNVDGPWPLDTILSIQDKTYRARRFAAGYYITDHFGAPACLITQGTHYWVFCTSFEAILWPYFVKLLLTLHSLQTATLHLKAAAVSVEGNGTLLIGRGGSGKTVLLTRLCQNGAEFLSNTHTLVDGPTLIAVPAAMRVRNDALFGPMITARGLTAGIKPGEYTADPVADFGWQGRAAAPVKNICLVDYQGPTVHEIAPLDRTIALDYMDQFSLAVNVYGLKEDVLDALGGDIARFSAHLSQMKTGLRDLIEHSSCYHVSSDATVAKNLQEIYERLARSS